ncbi:hypothetical protein SAMN05443633_102181 [Chryseobacterium arachidis]|uniref:Uncharacterized protein n=1 Tax=Chryseobacterium arachidis TaxID=1416778 RepID=A0A1M4WZE8_9FLAO|nr:hypothetical protein [Chryseobacterium arachidis]SHE86570.1 hypothetical protein SAMN05443633_102181 [Chryseobacterium arachidis]
MKKIFFGATFCLTVTVLNGQIAIGKPNIDGNSTILDFDNIATNTRGIILPAVSNTNSTLSSTPTANNGTFIFDLSDNKIKMYENNIWKDLSDAGNSSAVAVNSTAELPSLQGVIMGSSASDAKGILVLESANKSMILPKIANPHTTVKSPYPGMMCYDTAGKAIAVFDGNVWNYWK